MGKTRPQREMGYRIGTVGLVEADQVKSKVLDPVEQAVEFVRSWLGQASAWYRHVQQRPGPDTAGTARPMSGP
jgi:hypothetical protein